MMEKQINTMVDSVLYEKFKAEIGKLDIPFTEGIDTLMRNALDKEYLFKDIVNFTNNPTWDLFRVKCNDNNVSPKNYLLKLIRKDLKEVVKKEEQLNRDEPVIKYIQKVINKLELPTRQNIIHKCVTKKQIGKLRAGRIIDTYDKTLWYSSYYKASAGRPTKIYSLKKDIK